MILLLLSCAAEPDLPPAPDVPDLVEVAGATFTMGHPDEPFGDYGQEWKENELLPHEVTVSPFALAADEITVQTWAGFLDALSGGPDPDATLDRHYHPLQPVAWTGRGFEPGEDEAERPARFVSWYDATALCAWLGLRLPTEAEWELAAKGADDPERRYPWEDEAVDCSRAVYFTGVTPCEARPDVAGSRSPAGDAPSGARDMAGNVAEWVADRYGPYGAEPQTDPTGPAEGDLRVVRGGGYREGGDSIRVTSRFGARPQDRSEGVGLRCAVSR